MAITLTTPETRSDATQAHVKAFNIIQRRKRAYIVYEVGFIDGGFTETREVRVEILEFPTPGEPLQFAWDTFLSRISEVRDLKTALETEALAVGIFDGILVPD